MLRICPMRKIFILYTKFDKIYFMNTLEKINEIFDSRKEYKQGIFTIDDENGEVEFEGIYKEGELWNGWYSPYFKLDVAQKVLAIQPSKEDCVKYDMNYFEISEDGEHVVCITNDGIFVDDTIVVDDVRYFAIGYFCWTWDKKNETI